MGLVKWELRAAEEGEKRLWRGEAAEEGGQTSPESSGLFPDRLIGLDKQDGG